jgi:hypothetical protein
MQGGMPGGAPGGMQGQMPNQIPGQAVYQIWSWRDAAVEILSQLAQPMVQLGYSNLGGEWIMN